MTRSPETSGSDEYVAASVRPLTEDEKWSRPHKDDWWGLVRHRITCQYGEPSAPGSCIAWAQVKRGKKKLCRKHANVPAVRRVPDRVPS